MPKNRVKGQDMTPHKKQTKDLIKRGKTKKNTVKPVDNLSNASKGNIEYSRYTLSPSCFGVSAYIYSINTKNNVKIECEIRDNQEPDISRNYKFKYCSLSVKKGSTRIRFEENTKLAQNIFLRMHELYNRQYH